VLQTCLHPWVVELGKPAVQHHPATGPVRQIVGQQGLPTENLREVSEHSREHDGAEAEDQEDQGVVAHPLTREEGGAVPRRGGHRSTVEAHPVIRAGFAVQESTEAGHRLSGDRPP
jgi:hypothetical protein